MPVQKGIFIVCKLALAVTFLSYNCCYFSSRLVNLVSAKTRLLFVPSLLFKYDYYMTVISIV